MPRTITKKKIDYKNYPATLELKKSHTTILFAKVCKYCNYPIGLSALVKRGMSSKAALNDLEKSVPLSEAYCKENRGFHNDMEKQATLYG